MEKNFQLRLLFRLSLIAVLPLFFSCARGESNEHKIANDSIAYDLKIATLPTIDALPLYLAQQSGMLDSINLKVALIPFKSQFDCDTALINESVDAIFMDKVRQAKYKAEGYTFYSVMNICNQYALVTSKDSEIYSIRNLSNQTVAIARQSADDEFCEQTLNKFGIALNQVHYPQINDLYLRTQMLNNRQVDAAVLPEPMATMAYAQGHKVLHKAQISTDAATQIVCLANHPRKELLNQLSEVYHKAQTILEQEGLQQCHEILSIQFKVPANAIDTLFAK